jgi:hypothetical protein
VDIAAEVGRIVVDASTRANMQSTILPSPVVMDVVDDKDCMSAPHALDFAILFSKNQRRSCVAPGNICKGGRQAQVLNRIHRLTSTATVLSLLRCQRHS